MVLLRVVQVRLSNIPFKSATSAASFRHLFLLLQTTPFQVLMLQEYGFLQKVLSISMVVSCICSDLINSFALSYLEVEQKNV